MGQNSPTSSGERPDERASAPSDPGAMLSSLLRLCVLDRMPRTGWLLRGIETPESVAGHSLGVAHVALALAPRLAEPVDLGLVLAMAILHDAPEALSGDLPRPASRHLPEGAKEAMERALAREVVDPLSEAARAAYAEYQAGASREARFVKACDALQMGVRLLAYEAAGKGGLGEFWTSLCAADLTEFPECSGLLQAIEDAR